MENSRRGHQANTDAASKISAPQASPLPTDQSAASAQQAQCSAPSDVLETERVGQRERASTGNQGANVLSAFQTHHLSLKSYPVLDFFPVRQVLPWCHTGYLLTALVLITRIYKVQPLRL
jgi:hypothetical protein